MKIKIKIIILEGIATSGKTTIKDLLIAYFKNKSYSYSIVEEDEILMPFLHNTNQEVAKNHLKEIIEKYFSQNKDFLIFDRLYFTHIHRTNYDIREFKDIEDLVKDKDCLLVFLKIYEKLIPERIFNAMKHRSNSWGDYVRSKGNKEEIIKYYTSQQRKLLKYLEESSINSKIIDTTKMDFDEITNQILDIK